MTTLLIYFILEMTFLFTKLLQSQLCFSHLSCKTILCQSSDVRNYNEVYISMLQLN